MRAGHRRFRHRLTEAATILRTVAIYVMDDE